MIKYIKGDFKYQLDEDYKFKTEIIPDKDISTYFIYLSTNGDCLVRKGYAWDGPSGPTIDTKDFMRASLEHDVKYELMRKELIDEKWRQVADIELKNTALEDGMSEARAEYVYVFVRDFGKSSADPKNRKPILTAP
jgi:hypothetical protein